MSDKCHKKKKCIIPVPGPQGVTGPTGPAGTAVNTGATGPTGPVGASVITSGALLHYTTGNPTTVTTTAVIVSGSLTASTFNVFGMGSNLSETAVTSGSTVSLASFPLLASFSFTPVLPITINGIAATLASGITAILTVVTSVTYTVAVLVETGMGTDIFTITPVAVNFTLTAGGPTTTPLNAINTGTSVSVPAQRRILLAAYISAISPSTSVGGAASITSTNGINASLSYTQP